MSDYKIIDFDKVDTYVEGCARKVCINCYQRPKFPDYPPALFFLHGCVVTTYVDTIGDYVPTVRGNSSADNNRIYFTIPARASIGRSVVRTTTRIFRDGVPIDEIKKEFRIAKSLKPDLEPHV